MKRVTIAAVGVLLTCSALMPHAMAAGESRTRNWGGLWLGFGAGYAGTNASGNGSSRGCMSSSDSAGMARSTSLCVVNDDYITTVASADASENGVNLFAETSAFAQRSESLAGASSATASVEGFQVIGAASASAVITSSGNVTAAGSASTGATGLNAGAAVAGSGSGTEDVALLVSGNPPATGKADAVSIGTLNTVTGALAGASYQATSVGSSWSEALAIGFDGLKGGNLSGSDGGLSPEILLRLDHQTESNFLFGAEISLSIPGGNDSGGSDTSTYGLSSEEYTSPDLNIRRSVTVDTTALASARLRLGYAIGDYLAYGTGGLAYARYTATSTTTGSFNGAQVSQSLDETDDAFGGVIGGGISTFVADNAVVSIEALYYLFDAETEFDGGYGASASLDDAFSVMTTLSIRAY